MEVLCWAAIAAAGINASMIWVFYLALEPWVRRRWPQTMISWSHYVVKGVEGPLVGRDLLFSIATGMSLIVYGCQLLQPASADPILPSLAALNGSRVLTSEVLKAFAKGLFLTLLLFYLLFVLRWVLRKQWIALVVFIGIFVAADIGTASNLWLAAAFLAIFVPSRRACSSVLAC